MHKTVPAGTAAWRSTRETQKPAQGPYPRLSFSKKTYRGEWATMGQFLLYNVSNFFDTIVTLVNACSQRLISWRRYLVAKILKINKEKRQKIQNAKSKF